VCLCTCREEDRASEGGVKRGRKKTSERARNSERECNNSLFVVCSLFVHVCKKKGRGRARETERERERVREGERVRESM